MFAALPNVISLCSVETDPAWHARIGEALRRLNGGEKKTTLIYHDLDARGNWGRPGGRATLKEKASYSGVLSAHSGEHQFDLVFIDGRFRVACCLKCFSTIGPSTLIAFDDFLDRPKYWVVLRYFEVVDESEDKRMVILAKKTDVPTVPDDLIKKYEQIPD